MSTSAIASLSPRESGLLSALYGNAATQTASAAPANTAAPQQSAPSPAEPPDGLTRDLVRLLKALVSGDVSGAQNDLAQFKVDLKAQATTTVADATAAATSDASTGVNAAGSPQQDLQTQAASGARTVPPSIQTVTPLDALAGKLSAALSTGSTSTALEDVADYLVRSGHGTGSLVNTTA